MTKPELIAELGRRIRKIEHPELTDEEALEKELTFGCRILRGGETLREWIMILAKPTHDYFTAVYEGHTDILTREMIVKIIGLPLTLPRVLAALSVPFLNDDGFEVDYSPAFESETISVLIQKPDGHYREEIAYWKLRINGRDCTADDQSEETLQALIELFHQAK